MNAYHGSVFAAKSFTQCPLTLDYGILLNFIDEVESGMIEDGTAIGMAIANAANRLRDSKAKSKIVILLTDGQNNKGQLDPITAAKVGQAFDIRIYTVGVGKRGAALRFVPGSGIRLGSMISRKVLAAP